MPIRKLSLLLINQIAAGEVIERPASVVKELVENSLDAGARRVDVVVEEGGSRLIRISDDGCGIPPDELPLALSPHATSKIQTAEDLAAIATLGFRGEALASIASVSRLRITSRATADGVTAEAAAMIEATGDQVSDVAPAAGAPGTVMEVRDLFFNTPARRKFMRAASTEFGHIHDYLLRIAMVNPHVAFRLEHNGRSVRELPACPQNRRQRCVDILGGEVDEGLLEFEHIDPPSAERSGASGARIWGLAGLPPLARATSKFQYVYVNGRSVKDRNLQHAVKEAYRGLMPPDKQPTAVVMIDMDPHEVDVNVHPTKAEVRFRNPQQVHGLVLTAMRRELLASDLTPNVAPAPGSFPAPGSGFRFPISDSSSASGGTSGGGGASGGKSEIPPEDVTAFVDYFKRMAPAQKGFVYSEVKKQLESQTPADGETSKLETSGGGFRGELPGGLPGGALGQYIPAPTPMLQVRNSFVVTQDDDALLIVDQHALHERVMFEELSQRILGQGRPLESQRLLMPVVVEASAKQAAMVEELTPLLERIGIEAAMIGPQRVAVHAFPTFLFERHVEADDFMRDLLDKAEEGKFDTADANALEEALHKVIDMMSCKAAVKAGDKLSDAELAALLAKRESVERSSNCPHGRPTTLRLSLKDLERQFGR